MCQIEIINNIKVVLWNSLRNCTGGSTLTFFLPTCQFGLAYSVSCTCTRLTVSLCITEFKSVERVGNENYSLLSVSEKSFFVKLKFQSDTSFIWIVLNVQVLSGMIFSQLFNWVQLYSSGKKVWKLQGTVRI